MESASPSYLVSLGEQLWWACTDNRCKEAKQLIDEGAEFNWGNEYGITPLMIAADRGHI